MNNNNLIHSIIIKSLLIVLLIFVCFKSNNAQNIEWLQGVNSNFVYGTCIKKDKLGNLFVAGIFQNSTNYNGIPINTSGGTNDQDVFFAKYDSLGTFLWVKTLGGPLIDELQSFGVDDSGNAYLVGLNHSPATFDTITSNDSGVFIAKYSNNGNIIWLNQIKGNFGSGNTNYIDLAISSDESIYTIHAFLDSAIFNTTTIYSQGVNNFYLVKYDSNGTIKWVKQGNSKVVFPDFGIGIDSNRELYISGTFQDTISIDNVFYQDINNSNAKFFIAKFDSIGDVLWIKSYFKLNGSLVLNSNNLVISNKGNVFIKIRQNNNGEYISKIDSSGQVIWTTDTVPLPSISLVSRKIVCDKNESIYSSGYLTDTINFYGVKYFDATHFSNTTNSYLAKFDSTGRFDWVKIGFQSGGGSLMHGVDVDDQLKLYAIGTCGQGTRFDNFSISSNSSTFILKLLQTGIGIADSLVITNYNSVNDTAFTDDHATSILADTNGIIYSGSKSGGLVVYNGITWRSYNTSNSSIPSDSISNLFLDDSNQVWICTYDSGLVKFDTINWNRINTSTSGIPTNHITCGAWRNDTIFLGTDLDDVVITDGVVWFGSYTNVYPGIPHDGVNDIKDDQYGNLWIATKDSGLVRVDTGGVTVYNYANSGLPANTIQCLYVDANNTLWLGTDSNGLASFDGTNWRMFNSHNTTLPDNNIQSIVSGPSGKILVGTQSKGVGVFDGYTWELINDIIGLPDSNVISIIFSDSVYWAGMHDMGVVKFALPNDTFPGTGIENVLHKTGNSLMCYPNPFTSRIVVSYSLEKTSDTKIRMYDVMGKLVAERRFNNQMPGKYELAINDISLPEGLYFLQLLTDKVSQTARVVVTH